MVDKLAHSISQLNFQIDESVKRLKTQAKEEKSKSLPLSDDGSFSASMKVSKDFLSLSLNNYSYSKLDGSSLYDVQLNYNNSNEQSLNYANNSYETSLNLGSKQKVVLDFMHPNNQRYDFKI